MFDCCIGRENVVVVHMLLCTNHTHIVSRRDHWHRGKNLKHGCCCTAAALLLYIEFVTAHTQLTHTWYIQKCAHMHLVSTNAP